MRLVERDGDCVVEVLLATYNGERFLREQVESILSQDWPEVLILARDDGSGDGTARILAEYATRFPERFRVLAGESAGGAKGNFLELMRQTTAEYVCFADQDDVWLPGKVRLGMEAMRALEARHGLAMPLLTFSDLRVVGAELKTVSGSMWAYAEIEPESALRLERLVGQSVVTGCTMTINRRLLELARRMPEEATMHDRWIALLAAAMGETAMVREAMVLYRQHGGNVVGAAAPDGSVSGMAARTPDGGRRAERRRCEAMAEALLRQHGDEMPAGRVALLEAYLRSGQSESAVERVGITLREGFFRPGVVKTMALLWDLARSPSDAGFSERD